MIRFVENKRIAEGRLLELWEQSAAECQWTNFGPVSLALEREIARTAGITEDLRVVACASGTAALHALVQLKQLRARSPMRWVVSSYGFACTVQGPLRDARVVDCRVDGMFDVAATRGIEFDGLIVTNLFGSHSDLEEYRTFAAREGKALIVDAATALDSMAHGPDEIISFHHTKPWGFGEGGCAIVRKEDEKEFRSIINLGLVAGCPVGRAAFNGKMSDVAAGPILARLYDMPSIRAEYRRQYDRIAAAAAAVGVETLGSHVCGTPSNAPLVFPAPIENLENSWVTLQKYYRPIVNCGLAADLFRRIVNFPCHGEMERLDAGTLCQLFEHLRRQAIR